MVSHRILENFFCKNNFIVGPEVRIHSIVLSPLDRVLDLADFSVLVVGKWP